MARIRTIKPEIWTSEQFVECSTNARLLFVGLLNFCDDGGVHVASTKRLKMEVFPGDPFTDSDISDWVDELLDAGLLGLFKSQDQRYWWVTGWDRHQKIDRPNRKYRGPFDEGSTIIRRGLDDHSPPEGSLRESKGEDSCPEPSKTTDAGPPVPSEFVFPTKGKGGATWTLPQAKLNEYREAFPGVDVDREILRARQWCRDNPSRRKTSTGMLGFLTRWLGKEQNSGRTAGVPDDQPPPPEGIL